VSGGDEVVANVHYQWSAGEVCFDCPGGVVGIMISEGGESAECACGRVYTLHHFVTVVDKVRLGLVEGVGK
jgi:hypothetical protein